MKLNRLSLILALGLLFSCGETKDASLKNFNIDGDVFSSGESLISLSFGLHDLEASTLDQKTLLIGVHGSNSRGYEWVYPLQVLDNDTNLISFFRWNDKGCPGPSVISLLETIKNKMHYTKMKKNGCNETPEISATKSTETKVTNRRWIT